MGSVGFLSYLQLSIKHLNIILMYYITGKCYFITWYRFQRVPCAVPLPYSVQVKVMP